MPPPNTNTTQLGDNTTALCAAGAAFPAAGATTVTVTVACPGGLVALPVERLRGAPAGHLEAGVRVVRHGPRFLGLDFLPIPPAVVCVPAGLPRFLLGRGVRGQGAGVEDDGIRGLVFTQVIFQKPVPELGPGDGHAGIGVFYGAPLIHGSAEGGQNRLQEHLLLSSAEGNAAGAQQTPIRQSPLAWSGGDTNGIFASPLHPVA